jgi:tetratricopeptide (TPR) repeat protein
MKLQYTGLLAAFLVVATGPMIAQVAKKAPAVDPPAAAKQSLSLAEHGKCKEALQLLRKSATPAADKDLRLKAGIATVRCALNREQTDVALEAIQILNREFPHGPEVLYLTTHAYSDLSTRAALELARTAPDSYQAHEMNAEALEMQGKWDDAAAEYRKILERNPELPGIHFRMGRLIVSKPETPTMREDAKKEFEAELKIDPSNAGAEYILGEFARQEGQWEEAIEHFTKATKLDAGLTDSLFGLGTSFLGDGKPVEAIPPLETYVKLQPGNPAGHYQLAMAYNRAGRKEDAKREAALQRETAEKIEQEKQKAENAPQPAGAAQQSGPPK